MLDTWLRIIGTGLGIFVVRLDVQSIDLDTLYVVGLDAQGGTGLNMCSRGEAKHQKL